MYQILIRILSPFIVIFLAFEAIKKQGGKRFFKQRIGFSYATRPPTSSQPIWIHCASVGEVKSIETLVKKLLATETVFITTSTTTSSNIVKTLFSTQVIHYYLPFDWSSAMQRFLKKTNPKALWIVETEIWPNLYQLAHKKNIPITILNARLSSKTLNAPKWLQKTYKSALKYPSRILAKSTKEAEHFMQLGAPSNIISIVGNLKYSALKSLPEYPNQTNKPYILLASSHQDEEYQISQIWLALKRPEQFIIIPRHPQRISIINKQLLTLTASIGIFSAGDNPKDDFKIFIDDRIGFLMPWFSHAEIVIMGGSFTSKGGHNILEPAALKKAIIVGSDMSNFEDENLLLKQAQGSMQCAGYHDLKKSLITLLIDKNQRLKMGENAFQAIQPQLNILDDYLRILIQDLNYHSAP